MPVPSCKPQHSVLLNYACDPSLTHALCPEALLYPDMCPRATPHDRGTERSQAWGSAPDNDMGSTSDKEQCRGDEKGAVTQTSFIHSLTCLLIHSFSCLLIHSFTRLRNLRHRQVRNLDHTRGSVVSTPWIPEFPHPVCLPEDPSLCDPSSPEVGHYASELIWMLRTGTCVRHFTVPAAHPSLCPEPQVGVPVLCLALAGSGSGRQAVLPPNVDFMEQVYLQRTKKATQPGALQM